jgi:Fe-S-cluster containining protein
VPSDRDLIQIVDAAMAEAVRRGGSWIHCHIGCTECCMGPFPITPLDARRLRAGLAELAARDPERAGRIHDRAGRSVERIRREYPGHPVTAVLAIDGAIDDEACPVLDPATGACDLYAARPITCRTFGPSVRLGDGLAGVCHLCYQGAADEEIARCQVDVDPGEIEAGLLREFPEGDTIVALALAEP